MAVYVDGRRDLSPIQRGRSKAPAGILLPGEQEPLYVQLTVRFFYL